MDNHKLTDYISSIIVPSIISGLLAVLITFFLTTNYEKERTKSAYKMDILKGVVGFRYVLGRTKLQGSEEFIGSLNQIPLAFNSSPDVISSYRNFLTIRQNEGNGENANRDAFMQLLKSMFNDVGLDISNFDTHLIQTLIVISNDDA